MLADTHTFSPTVLNDIRLNYTRGRFSNTVDPQWDPYSGTNLNTAVRPAQHHQGRLALVQYAVPRVVAGRRRQHRHRLRRRRFHQRGRSRRALRHHRHRVQESRQHEPEVRRGHLARAAERDSAVRRIRRHLCVRRHADQFHRHLGGHGRQPVGQLPAGRAERQRHPAQRVRFPTTTAGIPAPHSSRTIGR